MNAAATTAVARGEERKREAEAIERKIAGIMTAIEDGMYTPALKARMKVLEGRKAEIEAIMASAEPPSVVQLHGERGRDLPPQGGRPRAGTLNDDSIKAEAGEILRSLIDRVVLTPAADAPDEDTRSAALLMSSQ